MSSLLKEKPRAKSGKMGIKETSYISPDSGSVDLADHSAVYRQILKSLSNATFLTDLKGNFLDYDQNGLQIFGLVDQEIKALGNISALFGETLWEEHQLIDNQEIFIRSREIEDKLGQLRIVDLKISLISPENKIVLVVCNDITDTHLVNEILSKRTQALDERVGEIHCLYNIAKQVQHRDQPIDNLFTNIAEIISESWPHPELTCVRITFGSNEYCSKDFLPLTIRRQAKFKCVGKDEGSIEIFFSSLPEEEQDISSYAEYEKAFIQVIATTVGSAIESRLASRELEIVNSRLDMEQSALTEKNTALREILFQIDEEKKRIASQVQANVERVIMPILGKLEECAGPIEKEYVELLRTNLSDVVSPFMHSLQTELPHLSPRETQICSLLRSGLSCKEVARYLGTSVHTVLKQRQRIRNKLGISNSKTNLTSYLNSI